jgi:D-3-phosphoglycerate dehydrogenase
MKLLGNTYSPSHLISSWKMELRYPLGDLLAQPDGGLNCDLNPSSFHLINENTLSLMKPGAVLITALRQ